MQGGLQTLFGFGDGVAGEADQHIGSDAFRRSGHPCGKEPVRGIHQWRPVVWSVVGEKDLFGLYGENQVDVPVLEAGSFEASREFDPAHPLFVQHGEDRTDVLLRAGQQVVVQNIASWMNRQLPQRALPFRHFAEPATVGAASGGDDVSGSKVSPRNEIASGFSRGRPAHFDRSHFRPSVGEELCPFPIP